MAAAGLSPEDHRLITDAIAAVEQKTSGEIYVVVAQTADRDHYLSVIGMPLIWAALIALLLPWPLLMLTDLSTSNILLIQVASFIAVSLLLSHAKLYPLFVPTAFAADASRRTAQQLFLAHGVHLTEARTGVLIYVAPQSRRVEIVADDGIHRKVDQSAWDGLAAGVATAARDGRLVQGIVQAVIRAGDLLAEYFPPAANNRNELSDRVVEI